MLVMKEPYEFGLSTFENRKVVKALKRKDIGTVNFGEYTSHILPTNGKTNPLISVDIIMIF